MAYSYKTVLRRENFDFYVYQNRYNSRRVSCETMQANDIPKLMKHFEKKYGREITIAQALAKDAVDIADALIAELNKTEP